MAPFKSKSQAKRMHVLNPGMAKEFAKKTLSLKALPEKVSKEKKNNPVVPKT